jgi:hypothetical protein
MIAEVRADLAVQLERVRAAEREGETDSMPRVAATPAL